MPNKRLYNVQLVESSKMRGDRIYQLLTYANQVVKSNQPDFRNHCFVFVKGNSLTGNYQ